jgi:hypothetical protein
VQLSLISGVPILAVMAAGCAGPPVPSALYDPSTRQLVRLDADVNGNGVVDTRTYANGSRILRSEVDEDEDGRVDRWEYLDDRHAVTAVGTSSRASGVEDVWTFAEAGGETRVDRALDGERHPTRREFYRSGVLARAEEDTNRDGRIDKWETFESGRLRSVAFDTSGSADRPNRRLVYDRNAQFSHVESDDNRDGQFERVNR